ncbi:MAG: hypothetical protein IJQ73_08310 [Kiritimatiellae bacterium]|nr:hypothetical protein [Kiritimatiellia bacterium]
MAISSIQIATNRYAPEGSAAVNLYGYELASGLALGQLVQAVCIRSAAAYEAQSVIKMNQMTAGSQILAEAADWLEEVAAGTDRWPAARAFCIDQLGVPSASLPAADATDIKSYARRMQVAAAMQDKMNALAQSQQEDMIDLQTMVNRRDVAYSTSSGVVHAMGQSQMEDAGNFLP